MTTINPCPVCGKVGFHDATSSGVENVASTALLAAADYHDEVAKAAGDNAELSRYTRSDFDFWCQKRRKHRTWAEAIRQAANDGREVRGASPRNLHGLVGDSE